MTETCVRPGCTVSTTGRCVLNIEPSATCPVLLGLVPADADTLTVLAARPGTQRSGESDEPMEPSSDEEATAPPPASPPTTGNTNLAAPKPARLSLSPARELGLDGLLRLSRKRPVRLIGLLGEPKAGKSMALVSMFLLAARGKLDGYEYRNSETLYAFDELSNGARSWSEDGNMLEQLVPRTELADVRRPGFLHLRLFSEATGGPVDLAFPDLPGEWTQSLVNKDVYDRLAFLQNAEAIWIFVDGERLANVNFGYAIAARTCRLIGKLGSHLPNPPPLKLVITRADQYADMPPVMLEGIIETAAEHNFELAVHEIVSVDRATLQRSGEGMRALLDQSITVRSLKHAVEPPLPRNARQALNYRAQVAL